MVPICFDIIEHRPLVILVLVLIVLSEILAERRKVSHFNVRVYLYNTIRSVNPEELENVLDTVVKIRMTRLDIKGHSIIHFIEKVRLVPDINLIQVLQRFPVKRRI